jgi:non-specific serine/threonine protein kinase
MAGVRAPLGFAVFALLAACTGGGRPSPATVAPPGPAVTAPATTAAPAPTSLVWQSRTPAPEPVQEVASVVLGDRVWVIGGLTAAGATARVDTYDPATDRWSPGPDLPVALHHAAAAVYRGEVVVAGGFQSASDLYSRPSDRVFALRNGAWVELPRLRRPRGAAGAAVVGDTLYVVGGRDSTVLTGATEAFDGTSWRERAAIPTPRDHLGAVSDGHVLYAVGGRFLSPAATADSFERYDPSRDAWTGLPPLPTARGGIGVTLAGGRIVVAGGEDASNVYAQVEAFDVGSGGWSSLADDPSPRHGLALAAVGNGVYALVGGVHAGVAPSAVADALVPR